MADVTFTSSWLRNYIDRRIAANNAHLKRTEGTEYHEPEWYDGANTALTEMISQLGLDD